MPLAALKSVQKVNRLFADLFADTVMDCYCRDETGPLDMTGYDLTAWVHPYNGQQPLGVDYGVGSPGIYVPWRTSFPATQIEKGHLQFTVTHGAIRERLAAGMFRVFVTAEDPANPGPRTRVYTALMTIQ